MPFLPASPLSTLPVKAELSITVVQGSLRTPPNAGLGINTLDRRNPLTSRNLFLPLPSPSVRDVYWWGNNKSSVLWLSWQDRTLGRPRTISLTCLLENVIFLYFPLLCSLATFLLSTDRLVFLLSCSVHPRPSDLFLFPFISYSTLFIATVVNL